MATINLLPWREDHRQAKKREFLQIAVFVLLFALLTAFIWDRAVNLSIDNQSSRNELLKTEIAVLEEQVQEIALLKKRKQQMLDRMEVIQGLQTNRPDIVRIFDELVRAVPDGVYLNQFDRTDLRVSVDGFAESNNRVSSLMRNLDVSYKFTDPNLTMVKADPTLGEQGNRFEMRTKLTRPEVDSNE